MDALRKKFTMGTTIFLVMVIIIYFFFNILIGLLEEKKSMSIDMTRSNIYTLSTETKRFLKDYSTDTEIYILKNSESDVSVDEICKLFSTTGKTINLQIIDLKKDPSFGSKYISANEDLNGKYVIIDGNNKYKTFSIDDFYVKNYRTGEYSYINVEDRILSALKYIASKTYGKVCLISGHGELDAESISDNLKDEGYYVHTINLFADAIPADTKILIDYVPKTDYSVTEISKLDNFLQSGGNYQLYLNGQQTEKFEKLYSYIEKSNIKISDNVSLEKNNSNLISIGGGETLNIPEVSQHDITDALITNKKILAYPNGARVLEILSGDESINLCALLQTSESAIIVQPDGTQKNGRATIGILAENRKNNSKIYVTGTSMLFNYSRDVITATYGFGNYDFLSNMSHYMLGDELSTSVSPKLIISGTMSISPFASYAAGISIAIIIPLLLLCMGIVVWIKRRNL